MNKIFTFLILSLSSVSAIDFEFVNNHDISVEVNGNILENPFSGGLNQPKVQWLDWDLDQDSDLFLMDADGNLRYYRNDSSNDQFLFTLISTQFEEILSGGWFFFGDFNNDSLYDLVIQDPMQLNYARYLENNGDDFISIGLLPIFGSSDYIDSDPVMTPTFADIDSDGDLDFFTGNVVGTVNFYENLGYQNGIPKFEFTSNMWQNISIIGPSFTSNRHGASAINFIDLDGDGDLDLSWGDYFQQSLYIVWNIGSSQNPEMDLLNISTQYPINNPVYTAGQNMPTFTDIDMDGDPDLFLSVLSGAYGSQTVNNLIFYENTGSSVSPYFELQTHNFLDSIDMLTYTSPSFYDIDNDGDFDMFLGTQSDPTQPSWSGKIHFFLNIGTLSQPFFQLQSDNLFEGIVAYNLAPTFGDLDNDSLIDVIIGDSNGYLHHFESEQDLEFTYIGELENIDLSGHSDPVLIDIDDDDSLELLVGELNGDIKLYDYHDNQFSFIQTINVPDLDISYSTLDSYDIDSDGRAELIIGSENNGISIFRIHDNVWISVETNLPFISIRTSPAIVDANNDGRLELFVGNPFGGLYYLSESYSISCTTGDLNIDGIINILDIIQVVNILIYDLDVSDIQLCIADVNQDLIIDILDIVLLVNIIMDI